MFITPASFDRFGRKLTHDAAEDLARNWAMLAARTGDGAPVTRSDPGRVAPTG